MGIIFEMTAEEALELMDNDVILYYVWENFPVGEVIEGIDQGKILDEIGASDAIDYYGGDTILESIDIKGIEDYLEYKKREAQSI